MRQLSETLKAIARTHVIGTVTEYVVLIVRVVIDRDLRVSLAGQQLRDNVESLLEVALAVSGRMVSARQTGLQFVGVWLMVTPA